MDAIHNAQPDSWVRYFGVAVGEESGGENAYGRASLPVAFLPRRLIESLSTVLA
jgi:hypothetical protein